MALSAAYEQTFVCYVSWEGKYVGLDTTTATPTVTLEPIDWSKYKKCKSTSDSHPSIIYIGITKIKYKYLNMT